MGALIDDADRLVRTVVALVLGSTCLRAQTCADPAAAFVGLEAPDEPAELLVSEPSIAGELDGSGARACSDGRAPEIPIVLMSGDAGPLERRARAAGVRSSQARQSILAEPECEIERSVRR